MLNNSVTSLSNTDLDLEIVEGNLAALDESSRRVTLAHAILLGVSRDIELAMLAGVDVHIDFEPAGFALVVNGMSSPIQATTEEATLAHLRTEIGRHIPCTRVLTVAQRTLVTDEMDRCTGEYPNVTVKGLRVMGSRTDIRELAEGIECSVDDAAMEFRAECLASDGNYLDGDALAARTNFILRSIKASQKRTLKVLRGR